MKIYDTEWYGIYVTTDDVVKDIENKKYKKGENNHE